MRFRRPTGPTPHGTKFSAPEPGGGAPLTVIGRHGPGAAEESADGQFRRGRYLPVTVTHGGGGECLGVAVCPQASTSATPSTPPPLTSPSRPGPGQLSSPSHRQLLGKPPDSLRVPP